MTEIDDLLSRPDVITVDANMFAEMKANAARLEAKVTELGARGTDLVNQRDAAVAARYASDRDLTQFKEKVRNQAISAYREHRDHITRTALNDWLEELALAPMVPTWTCSGTWGDIDLPEATIEVETEDEAREMYEQAVRERLSFVLHLKGRLQDGDGIVWADHSPDEEIDMDDSDYTLDTSVEEEE